MRKIPKYIFLLGSLAALTPIFWLIFKLRDKFVSLSGPLLIKLFLLLLLFTVVWLVIKIIIKFIHAEEDESEIDTTDLTQLSLFNSLEIKYILRGFGLIVVILFVSLLPVPWNIFLMLLGFYLIFTYISQLA